MTPEYIDEQYKVISDARLNLLCEANGNLDPFAEQHFLLALSTLESALHQLRLAQLYLRQSIARRQ